MSNSGIWSAVVRSTLRRHGLANREDLLAALVARPSLPRVAGRIAEELGEIAFAERIEHELERQLTAQFSCEAHLVPGAIQMLRRLRLEYPLAVTSAVPQGLLSQMLLAAGIGEFFAAEVGEGSGRSAPPAPDVHLAAARRLGVAPARVIAVEASEAGAAGALAAGMAVVGPEAVHAAAEGAPIDFSQSIRAGASADATHLERIVRTGL